MKPIERYDDLEAMVKSFKSNFDHFYHRGNKSAGVRLRKNMQELRDFALLIRQEVQDINNGTIQLPLKGKAE